jgi:GDP-L-fucose synthase
MRVLISGSEGFVGSNFRIRLLRDWHEVFSVDIKNGMDLRRYVKETSSDNFDLIIHCAAVVGGRLKIDGDPLAVATNLAIDSDFWNWIVRGRKKKRVVYFSSSAVYPIELQERNRHCALVENLVDLNNKRFGLPDQTYGFAKFAGELLAKQAVERYGIEAVIYRPFSGYGEGQSLDYPFPSIIQRVKNRENPIRIWGSGDQERDFIHIDDVVEAVLATYDKLPAGTTLNLGNGEGISFANLAKLACVMADHKAKIEPDSSKPEGVFSRVADVHAMEQWYRPKILLSTGIERGLTALKY